MITGVVNNPVYMQENRRVKFAVSGEIGRAVVFPVPHHIKLSEASEIKLLYKYGAADVLQLVPVSVDTGSNSVYWTLTEEISNNIGDCVFQVEVIAGKGRVFSDYYHGFVAKSL